MHKVQLLHVVTVTLAVLITSRHRHNLTIALPVESPQTPPPSRTYYPYSLTILVYYPYVVSIHHITNHLRPADAGIFLFRMWSTVTLCPNSPTTMSSNHESLFASRLSLRYSSTNCGIRRRASATLILRYSFLNHRRLPAMLRSPACAGGS